MKLFHISDLHIGKILHEVNLLEEQKIVLAQVLALVDLHMPVSYTHLTLPTN